METGPLRVLVILGHPRSESLCGALADAFAAGAREAGSVVRVLRVGRMRFAFNVTQPSPRDQFVEEDVREAMALVAWADHLVFVFPTWWGTMPAALKAFLDRVFVPGFAFAEREDGEGWDRLLTGRSAHLITTMDTPPWVYRWIYRAPGLNGLGAATLGFCGVAPVRRSVFGPVKDSTAARRASWIGQVLRMGLRLRDGVLGGGEKRRRKVLAWVAALRLQFYPMTWAAYAVGAVGARAGGWGGAFWLGLGCLFALEVATVFANDLFDFESDRRNRHSGPFSGGSRVLVDGRITRDEMRAAILGVVAGFVVLLGAVAAVGGGAALPAFGVLAVLALGYTVPPLKLCWRGLGELDVALTHSFGAVLCGYLMAGGGWGEGFPWLVSLPLFFAILPSITLSGIPDMAADREAGKGTLAVLFGSLAAVRIAEAATLLAALGAVAWFVSLPTPGALVGLALFVVPYAAWQVWLLERYRAQRRAPGRIDGLMAASLAFVLLFVGVPLWFLTG